jgi:hypothetical protein
MAIYKENCDEFECFGDQGCLRLPRTMLAYFRFVVCSNFVNVSSCLEQGANNASLKKIGKARTKMATSKMRTAPQRKKRTWQRQKCVPRRSVKNAHGSD